MDYDFVEEQMLFELADDLGFNLDGAGDVEYLMEEVHDLMFRRFSAVDEFRDWALDNCELSSDYASIFSGSAEEFHRFVSKPHLKVYDYCESFEALSAGTAVEVMKLFLESGFVPDGVIFGFLGSNGVSLEGEVRVLHLLTADVAERVCAEQVRIDDRLAYVLKLGLQSEGSLSLTDWVLSHDSFWVRVVGFKAGLVLSDELVRGLFLEGFEEGVRGYRVSLYMFDELVRLPSFQFGWLDCLLRSDGNAFAKKVAEYCLASGALDRFSGEFGFDDDGLPVEWVRELIKNQMFV